RDVDVRSDVYALGVMLYEMLSVTLPHDVSSCSLRAAVGPIGDSMPRRLRDVAPGLPADYEIVVATAMAHDVQQRYQGAADLHDDVQRLLQREPIRARRPSMWYQLRRLVRRHRLASALIGAICLGLIIFTSVVTVQAFSLAQQRDQIQLELERANIEAEKANSVKIFMEQMFVAADPTFGKTDVTVLQALEQANALLEQDHDNHPQVRAAVRVSIAELLTGLGEYDKSTPMFEQAVSILREAQPVPAIDLAVALRFLAGNRFDTSRYDEAVPLLLESIGLFQQAGAASSPEGMRTRNDLGIIYHLRGDLDDAQHHYNLALQGRLAQDDVSPAAVAQSRHNLGSVLLDLERYDEAQVQLQAAIEYGQAHRPDSMSLSQSQKALGQVFLRTDRIAEALALFEANLAMCQRVLGDDHPQTILIRHHVAMGLRAAGQLDAAEATLDQVIAQSEARLGPDHLFTALARLTQAGCHFDQGRIEASRTLLDQVEPVLSAHYNPTHPNRVDAATLRAALHAH
ncbi:MAG: tetratricopeptide repeat protein, partial [Deltaproteobacteria bacterium]|nr:tetratricopeptide repeat protein [Deltaproteobacteria bacterium]